MITHYTNAIYITFSKWVSNTLKLFLEYTEEWLKVKELIKCEEYS